MSRESIEYDVVVVGGGPAGFATAIHIRQLAIENNQELSVCLLEKGSEIGAHILSGAVLEPTALNELIPDWKEKGAPISSEVKEDIFHYFLGPNTSVKIPGIFIPLDTRNHGNYIVSMGNVCRWFAEQAKALEVDIFPGFAAAEILYRDDGSVKGVATGDMGVSSTGKQKDSYEPGMELHAKYTVFAEGCRGHLGKQLIEKFNLRENADPQHYGIGIKEIWEIEPEKHTEGLAVHTMGWPTESGGFLYHADSNQVFIGYVVSLAYSNPFTSPYDEFQRWKHHPKIKQYIEGGKRISYGARALNKGGLQAVPKFSFPGGILAGCDVGFLVNGKTKGNHTAMKSGMLAAEAIFNAFQARENSGNDLTAIDNKFKSSWLYRELYKDRNFGPLFHKFGTLIGSALFFIDQFIFWGNLPFTLHATQPDNEKLRDANECTKINYLKPDGKISFDKLSSVFLSSTNHEEDQPCHLLLKDEKIPININLTRYASPEQHFCPAGVYEIIKKEESKVSLQINAQNCVHCKTCDIKDPTQNIVWLPPEGGGGPNYPNM